MITNQQRVSIINESLPFIREFSGKTFVIKYGGASMTNQKLKKKVAEDIAILNYIGVHPIVIHGGGPEINQMLNKFNIKSEFKQGLRVTDKSTMEVVEMVLTGKVQKEIVGLLNQSGAKAIGLSGKDGNLMKAKRYKSGDFDWGYTGEIESISVEVLQTLISQSFLPVISSVASNSKGETFNINADSVASSIAENLKTEKLILLTDIPGILRDKNNPDSLISKLNLKEAKELIEQKVIEGGMIPKVQSSIKAIESGVGSVHILDGTKEHVLLLETLTEAGVGTMITES
ncbi:MAG: acetylglutamate kinase [Candidatus Caenarcaniphilales bacterium]|nr:acetylglutamate kinase [Candidatus Caenarcaniphilales bacterium]